MSTPESARASRSASACWTANTPSGVTEAERASLTSAARMLDSPHARVRGSNKMAAAGSPGGAGRAEPGARTAAAARRRSQARSDGDLFKRIDAANRRLDGLLASHVKA
jgi:hypothetical protein